MMNLVFLPNEAAHELDQIASYKTARELVERDLRTNIVTADMTEVCSAIGQFHKDVEAITREQNPLLWLVSNIDNYTETAVIADLKNSCTMAEEIIYMNRLVKLNRRKYCSRMKQTFSKYGEHPLCSFDNDSYLVENYITALLQTDLTFNMVKKITNALLEDVTDLQSIESGFSTIYNHLMTRIHPGDNGYTDMIEKVDALIAEVAHMSGNSPEFFKSDAFYIKFVMCHKDIARLKPIIEWIHAHKEEMISANNLIGSNNGLHILLLLNKIKKHLLPELEFPESVWNSAELELLHANTFEPKAEYLHLFTTDDMLYQDMCSWYDLVLE